ncbi:unnamed protein product [Orchesella dallaii]|uniref:Hexosyltransferase n=1 Tax=Orchesella dallaii TaxID=48710 RepID=A0ABP1PZ27_9HEXA
MYVRVSTLSVIRAGRKFSRLPTLVGAIVAFVLFLFLVALISPEQGSGGGSYYERLSELSTWTVNQSVILTDYLDISSPNTFLLQPQQQLSYNGNPENLTSPFCGPAVQILIMVTSAPNNSLSRNAIRDTWGSRNYIWPKGVRLAFVLGRTNNETIQKRVTKEAEEFQDIVQEDFLDTYHNLTLKSMAMLKWINLTCSVNNDISSSPLWVLKSDDDMFINVDRLLKVAHDSPNSKMIGRLTCGALPIKERNSKLYMPKYLYPSPVYPGYLSGTAYLLRGDMVPTLLENSLTIPLIHLEDIYVTAILARQSQFFPDDSPFFTYNRLNPKDPCPFRYMVTSHQVTPIEMRSIWTNLMKRPPVPCSPKKQNWLRRIPKMTKRYRKLCSFPQ